MSEFPLLRVAVDDLAGRSASPDFRELKRRASRRRRRRRVATVGAVAFIVVGGGLATVSLDGRDQLIGEPATTSSASPTVQESAGPPTSPYAFGKALDAILEQVPGWASADGPYPTGFDYAFNGPCSGNWTDGATGGGDGGAPYSTSSDGMGHAGFPTAAQASDALASLVQNLTDCTATKWRTQPIARPGAVLASSAHAVAWIQRTGDTVRILQVRTTDGPPPVRVQVEVAEWMAAYHTWLEQQHE